MKKKTGLKKKRQKKIQIILVALIILLIVGISFRSGQYYQKEQLQKAIEVKLVSKDGGKISKEKKVQILAEALARKGIIIPYNKENKKETLALEIGESKIKVAGGIDKKCVFMASKKSNKYHSADCHFATRIKEENLICFSSQDEASKNGYRPAKCINDNQ